MTITSGTVLRVVAQMLWADGEITQNVFNNVISGAGSPFDEDDVMDDCLDWVEDMWLNFAAIMAAELDGGSVIVYRYDPVDDDWDEVGTINWAFGGGGAANTALPRGVAALVTVKSEDPDVDARKYIPGMTEADLTSELWTGATIAVLALFGADWVTAFVGAASGATFTPAVWSVVGKVAIDLIGTIIVPTIPAYQRRRKNNVGI